MSTILLSKDRRPTFGEKFASGLEEGGRKGLEFAQKLGVEQERQRRFQKQEDADLKVRGVESIQNMRDIIGRGKTGWNIFNYLTPEGRADRAALDAAALNLERLAVEMQGKGVLSKPRFEYMVKRLPSSGKTDAENEAILNEWEKILGEREAMEFAQPESKESHKQTEERKEKDFIKMRDPSGKLRKVSTNDVKKAKAAGYKAVK